MLTRAENFKGSNMISIVPFSVLKFLGDFSQYQCFSWAPDIVIGQMHLLELRMATSSCCSVGVM